jgi:hypothetical protein
VPSSPIERDENTVVLFFFVFVCWNHVRFPGVDVHILSRADDDDDDDDDCDEKHTERDCDI